MYFRFQLLNLHHLSVKNKLKCAETLWSKEKVQSSFISAERKKRKTKRLWSHSLYWEEAAAELHCTPFKESTRKNPFLGRKKLEQMRENLGRHLIRV